MDDPAGTAGASSGLSRIHSLIPWARDRLGRAGTWRSAGSGGLGVLLARSMADRMCSRREGETELMYIEYAHDPDLGDSTMEMLLFCLLRERGGPVRIAQDRHVIGLFSRKTWTTLLAEAGLVVETRAFFLEGEGKPYELLVGTLA